MNKKDFEMMNQKLIDGYIDSMKTQIDMLNDQGFYHAKEYRIFWRDRWVGRNLYKSFYRRDILEYAKKGLNMTAVEKLDLINFTLIDLKFEQMIVEHSSIMNGTFRNVTFFRFNINGSPIENEFMYNEYHYFRNIVLNCKFENCVFMNSYSSHTDWINCKFINCTFINSELCCEGSEFKDCSFENNKTIYLRT